MPRFDSDRDDIFFDALDDIRSAREPSPSDNCSTSDEGLAPTEFEYGIWASEPISVQERRQRFLAGMGFDEFVATRVDFCEPHAEIATIVSSANLEEGRISNISSLNSYVPENKSVFDATCFRSDLDCGKRYIVHNGMHGGLSSMLKEAASDKVMSLVEFQSLLGISRYIQKLLQRVSNSSKGDAREAFFGKKSIKNSWKSLVKNSSFRGICKYDVHVRNCTTGMPSRTRVQHRNKKIAEFSSVYMGQEIQAHKGLIRVMKFSPSGWYLASGGEDCVVRIWQITEVEASSKLYGGQNSLKLQKEQNHALAIIPKKAFHISETPLHEFNGHRNDILDMTWSKSDYLLTSSKDKTVRLWKVGCDGCLAIFKHNDYVTSVQFNPTDERYFISGSIDGKVRIWDALEKRVVDWADSRNIITAVSYQPDGKGFIVGTTSGGCRFYGQKGDDIQLDKELFMQGRKKSAASRINSLQLCTGDPPRIIVSSADSKIRITDGVDITQKFEGPWKSKALSSPSLTSDGRYLISAGKDSNVYIWNFCISGSTIHKREAKSVRSCEMFFSKDATIAVPWPGVHKDRNAQPSCLTVKPVGALTLHHHAECRSPGSWFFPDSMRGSVTWPEEKLPSSKPANDPQIAHCLSTISAAWNTVIVTASRDGVIRSFHNYGLPVRL